MKMVIDITEQAYNLLQNEGVDWLGAEHILDAVAKGKPVEECEDCVSRQAVLAEMYKRKENGDAITAGFIKNLLPVTAEKVEYNESAQVELEGDGYADGELVYDFGKCPKCGWEFEDGDKDWEEPYCCHCGQKLHWFETQEVEE